MLIIYKVYAYMRLEFFAKRFASSDKDAERRFCLRVQEIMQHNPT